MKILIVNNNMHIGGIQKALSNLLKEVSHHEITLFMFNSEGELMDEIDPRIKVIKGNFFTRILGMSQGEAKAKGIITSLFRGMCVVIAKVTGSGFMYKLLSAFQKLKENYDVAISYMQNADEKTFYGGCNEFVLNSVKAKSKISFVHCDFKNYPGNEPYNINLYSKFDKIACVSESVKRRFDEVCPQYQDKTFAVYNVYDFDSIKKMAEEYPVNKEGKTVLFTSARIREEKGILRMIPILERIKKEGGDFVWYVAGNGPQYEEVSSLAKEKNLSDSVIFLGMLKNPYPYFKNADILLVPSYNEAAPMVYAEALLFSTPVFTTDTTSAYEFIGEDNGWVIENNDEYIEKELKEIILKKKFKEKNPSFAADNKVAKEQFEELLN